MSLALCGGGRRGVAYFAFFEEFEKELKKYGFTLKDVIKAIGFSSSAALFTTLYLLGYNFKDFLREYEKRKWERLTRIVFTSNYLIYRRFLESFFKNLKVKDLSLRLFYVTLDLKTGKNVMLSKGKLVDVIYASTAHPLILPPLKKGNKVLVDGGFTQILPSKYLYEKGFRNIIGFELYKG